MLVPVGSNFFYAKNLFKVKTIFSLFLVFFIKFNKIQYFFIQHYRSDNLIFLKIFLSNHSSPCIK